ncbi:MAG: SDR family NAD(P)-dependent oxidoreductase [Armatimonadota bacterium]
MELENKKVIVTGADNNISREIVKAFKENGADVIFIRTDIDNNISYSNDIDILINVVGSYLSNNNSDYNQLVETNLANINNHTPKIIENMINQKSGLIINYTTKNCNLQDSVYSKGKCLVGNASDMLRDELGKFNIRVMCISASTIQSGIPYKTYKNISSPMQTAKSILKLALNEMRQFYTDEILKAA